MDIVLKLLFVALAGWAIWRIAVFANGKIVGSYLATTQKRTKELYNIAERIEEECLQFAHPNELRYLDDFLRGVKMLSSTRFKSRDLLQYASGANVVLQWLALVALGRRIDDTNILSPILKTCNDTGRWSRYFMLETIHKRYEEPVIVKVLLSIDRSWHEAVLLQYLKDFISQRREAGEKPVFANMLDSIDSEKVEALDTLLKELGDECVKDLSTEFKQWQNKRVDIEFIESFAKIWQGKRDPDIIEYEQILTHVNDIQRIVTAQPARSIILVGDSGVGKSSILELICERLHQDGWIVFEAGGMDLMSGQVYIGELEGRIKTLMKQIAGKRKIAWIVPGIHDLLWAGQHRYNPNSILDYILPYIERHQLVIIGETQPAGFEKMVRIRRRIKTAFEIQRIEPLSETDSLRVARKWANHNGPRGGRALISADTLKEASQLTSQYLSEKVLPGSLLQFLQFTLQRLTAANSQSDVKILRDDLLVTLSQLTGLPGSILDDNSGLDLDNLRHFFNKRVLGQTEPIDCLVERIAMIKAGLTDPTRPQGVFLFVGPTGTGKTEIAKALAEFLFGSAERMIRLDMSEFQTSESIDRILGEQKEEPTNTALVNQIRNQPFSVILLDEFEKANYNIWDLFLQVFDDGRLTDRRGNSADFRHCIIILTSNLGANIPTGNNIGFIKNFEFTAASVNRAVTKVFRKEFLNRLDRVVVFRPLDRGVMRNLLYKELEETLERRGLRTRSWAVEWDESAIDFLLRKGFTPDLGARPLKRAIERYLLAPLSLTIVNHQFPEGEQFLYVASDGSKITVEFIDPDAPADPDDESPDAEISAELTNIRLQNLILDGRGTAAEMNFLAEQYDQLQAIITGDDWRRRKDAALAQTAEPGFWTTATRFAVLGQVEYMDRIETGVQTAGSLLDRLGRSKLADRQTYSKELIRRLAQQIFLVDAACSGFLEGQPRDAFLLIEGNRESTKAGNISLEFAKQIGSMYQEWAKARKMHLEILEEKQASFEGKYRMMLAISGFASFPLLENESGLHVLQVQQKNKRDVLRHKIRVRVVPQPDEPVEAGKDSLLHQARNALANLPESELKIVRRYTERPTPLIRDNIKKWRTGNWQRVFDGNFDLF